MSIVAAMAHIQPALQFCLFAAMLAHMAGRFSDTESAPEATSTYEPDDIPLWPYAA